MRNLAAPFWKSRNKGVQEVLSVLTNYRTIREVARRIAGATDRSVEALREGRVEHEPAMTDRMLGAIEESIHLAEIRGIRWQAKTLTDRGRRAQEAQYGADFMGVLNIDLPDFKVGKGFLAQAKLVRGRSVGGLEELQDQCRKMLDLSADSFVFLYSRDGITVVPALSVLASRQSPLSLYNRSVQKFFEDHLACFIGDRLIHSPTPESLTALRDTFDARRLFLLQASEVDPSRVL